MLPSERLISHNVVLLTNNLFCFFLFEENLQTATYCFADKLEIWEWYGIKLKAMRS